MSETLSGVFDSGLEGDNTDFLANKKGLIIDIYHVPSRTSVKFKAFVTSYEDKFASEYNTEDVYGRMDPIQTFKGTKRNISLGWDVVSASQKEAQENMERCTRLFKMLYPTYSRLEGGTEGQTSASTITAGPIFRLKFANLIQDVTAGVSEGTTATAEVAGLVGTISGFKYKPDFDAGFFDEGVGTLFPQTINLSMEYTVNHTHPLGWGNREDTTEARTTEWPYNTSASRDAAARDSVDAPSTGDDDEAAADGLEIGG